MDNVQAVDTIKALKPHFEVYTSKNGNFTYYGPFFKMHTQNRAEAVQVADALNVILREVAEPTPTAQTLSKLVKLVSDMRTAQARFFANRQNTDLQVSKRLEKEVDQLIKQYEEGLISSSQPTLF